MYMTCFCSRGYWSPGSTQRCRAVDRGSVALTGCGLCPGVWVFTWQTLGSVFPATAFALALDRIATYESSGIVSDGIANPGWGTSLLQAVWLCVSLPLRRRTRFQLFN